jgi:DNA-binding response OmpR family regulator
MSRILVIEDDVAIRRSLVLLLGLEGFTVVEAASLTAAHSALDEGFVDLCLLDVNLPDGSGFDLCKQVRAVRPTLPVLFLTSRTDEDSVVKGLTLGGTDYIRKPFGNLELLARIRAALRRFSSDRVGCGPLVIDRATHIAEFNKVPLDLNRRELEMLIVFAEQPGRVFTREQLIARLGPNTEIYDRTIDSHLSHLRRKLKEAGAGSIRLKAIYGVGYRLEVAE